MPDWLVSGTTFRSALVGVAALVAVAIGIRAYRHESNVPANTARTYATQTGQKATIVLADGSRVTLAPRSTIAVTRTSSTGPLVVTLVGEARFDVESRSRTPFIVRTGAVTTRVLGTTFDVRRYAEDAVGHVVVLAGKVVTGSGRASTILTAGMIGRFTDSSVTTAAVTDPTLYTDWARGRLVFNETPVPVVLATLKRWYGYEFRLADSTLATEYVTTVFDIGDTNEMMYRLQRLLGVSMTIHRDSVILLRANRRAKGSKTLDRFKSHDLLPHPTEVGR